MTGHLVNYSEATGFRRVYQSEVEVSHAVERQLPRDCKDRALRNRFDLRQRRGLSNLRRESGGQAICPGAWAPIDISMGLTPYLHVTLDNRPTTVLIDTAWGISTVDSHINGRSLQGKSARLPGMLPTISSWDFYHANLGLKSQTGQPVSAVIGDDMMVQRIVEFHYDAQQPYVAVSAERCAPRRFEEAGLVSVSQHGFYSADQVRAANLDIARNGRSQIKTYPVIFIRIGTVVATALVDSGFAADSTRAMIMVNDAMFKKLRASGVAMRPEQERSNRDCNNKDFKSQTWQVSDTPLSMQDEAGQTLFRYGPPTLQVLSAGGECGDYRSSPEPRAVISALQFLRWGTIVLDGPGERLWLSKSRAPIFPAQPYMSMALAWTTNRAWSLSFGAKLDEAKDRALADCKEQGETENCKIGLEADGNGFRCISVAQSGTKLYSASATAIETAHEAARKQCVDKTQDQACKVVSAQGKECND